MIQQDGNAIGVIEVVVLGLLDGKARVLRLNEDTSKIAAALRATGHNRVILPLAKGRERLRNG